MKLKRLIIHGFKSFKDKTVINFDDKITGIVGPNGCGKSNIVDALFWVMGEQSAKHLRGKSMKDVIFAGSSKFKPGSWAQATLVIENTHNKHIHIGSKVCSPSEIELTRKLYRNGETEYRLNNEICRLKDIHEVFMDTGAGAKSYSIIAQGEINRMVQSKPEERRVMIEEVAGITKFKNRKKESLKKMEQTSENIKRIDDLQQEVDKNLKNLQKQAEKAQRAKSLKEKIKNNDLIVNSHKEFDFLNDFKIANECIIQKEEDLKAWKPQKIEIEESLNEERLKRDIINKSVKEEQSEYNDISKDLAAREERFDNICKNITNKESQLETRVSESEQIDEEILEVMTKLDDKKIELEELIETGAEGFEYDELETEVECLKEKLETIEASKDDLSSKTSEQKQNLQEIENNLFKISTRTKESSDSLQDLTKEIEDLEGRYSGVSNVLANQRKEINTLEEVVLSLTSEEEALKLSLKDNREKLKIDQSELNQIEKKHIQSTSKLSSLQEISKALDGANVGTSEFLNSNDSYQLLGNLVKCDEKYSKAVQVILLDYLNTVTGTGEEIYSWMNSEGLEKSTQYLAYNTESFYEETEVLERLKLKGIDAISLSDIVKELSFSNIMAGHFIVDSIDLNDCIEKLKGVQFKSITTIDGNICLKNTNGSILVSTGLNSNSGMGMVERNNLISSLIVDSEKLLVEKNELTNTVTELEKLVLEIQENYELKRTSLTDESTKLMTLKSSLESKLSNMEEGQTKLEILKERKNKISNDKLELLEDEEKYNNEIEILKEENSHLLEMLESSTIEYSSVKDELELKREELSKIKIQASTYDQKKQTLSSHITDLEERIIKINEKKERLSLLITDLEVEKEELDIEIKELEVSNLEKSKVLDEKKISLKEKRSTLDDLNKQMKEREDQIKKLTAIIASHEKDLVSHKSKIERVIEEEELVSRDIFEKYHIDLRQIISAFLEFTDESLIGLTNIDDVFVQESETGEIQIIKEDYIFNRRYGQDLRSCQDKFRRYKKELLQLGEINWQAMEDYERQKLRHDFLSHQKEELQVSLEDLQTAINQIDEKSKERFKIAFNEVTERFEKVFPIIFGGGQAKLSLVGSLEDNDCGIDIMASPPGKKMQNINLMSGGEKAMTAVSLIFSIFLVKPSPFCLLDEVDAPLDDANVGRFNELLREMSSESQFILITHNKKTMELNNKLYGVTMQEPGVSTAVSVHLQ